MRIGTGKRIGEAVTPGHVCIYGRTRKAKCFGYLFDTYPLLGIRCGLGYERLRAVSFAPEKWFTRHNVSGSFASMTNQSGSGSMLSFYLDYSFAMLRRWQLLDRLYVSGGGEAALTLGGLYNLRNSNNPATAKAAIDLGATAMASYHFVYHDCR